MSSIFYVQMDIPPSHEAEFNRIYNTEHVPELSKVPGVHRITRYQLEKSNDSRVQKYLAIYEIDSSAVTQSKEWDVQGAIGDWAAKIRPHTTSRHHTYFTEIGKAGKGRDAQAPYIYVVQMDIPAQYEAEFNRVYDTEHVPMIAKCCRGATRYRLEKSTDTRMQKYAVIYEIDSPATTETKEWAEAGAFGDWATKIRPHTTSRHHSFFKKI
jgi:hypothetical protein